MKGGEGGFVVVVMFPRFLVCFGERSRFRGSLMTTVDGGRGHGLGVPVFLVACAGWGRGVPSPPPRFPVLGPFLVFGGSFQALYAVVVGDGRLFPGLRWFIGCFPGV